MKMNSKNKVKFSYAENLTLEKFSKYEKDKN